MKLFRKLQQWPTEDEVRTASQIFLKVLDKNPEIEFKGKTVLTLWIKKKIQASTKKKK